MDSDSTTTVTVDLNVDADFVIQTSGPAHVVACIIARRRSTNVVCLVREEATLALQRRRLVLSVPLLSLLAVGCASALSHPNPFQASGKDHRIHIEISNHNFYDATIWTVVNGSRQQRLGTVVSQQNTTFTVPWSIPQNLQLDIVLVSGNASCRTNPLMVDPGDKLQLEIMSDLTQMQMCR